jgi:hypothetical protein
VCAPRGTSMVDGRVGLNKEEGLSKIRDPN